MLMLHAATADATLKTNILQTIQQYADWIWDPLNGARDATTNLFSSKLRSTPFGRALRWSLLEPAELEAGLRLAASLVRVWYLDRTVSEGGDWLTALLAQAPHSAARAEALSASGLLLVRRGNLRAAHPLLEEAVALARHFGDGCILASSLDHLGELRIQEGDLAGARSALEESLALTAEVADGPVFWPLYLVLSNRGELAVAEGDTHTAAAFYERSLDLARAQQDGFRSVPLRRY
jgi:tetratricopeptide (TPR) repeat protein